MRILVLVVGGLAVARVVVWIVLQILLAKLDAVIRQGQELLDKHGHTVGELERAGVLGVLDELEAKGGRFYRLSVPFAAFLMWWPIGPFLRQSEICRVAGAAGIFGKETVGVFSIYRDFRRGFARDESYYPIGHLKGLHAALTTAGLVW